MAKLPANESEWQAPWEKEGAGEFDSARAKTLLFNVHKEVEREQDAHAATRATLQSVTGEKDALQVEITALKADTSLDELRRENATLKADAEKAQQSARSVMLDAVKNEFGLTDRQVAKLDGDDLEALRLDAKETFGEKRTTEGEPGGKGDDDDDDDDKGKGGAPKTQPDRLRNPGDRGQQGRGKEPTDEEALAQIRD